MDEREAKLPAWAKTLINDLRIRAQYGTEERKARGELPGFMKGKHKG